MHFQVVARGFPLLLLPSLLSCCLAELGAAQDPAPEWTYRTPGRGAAVTLGPDGKVFAIGSGGTNDETANAGVVVMRFTPANPVPDWIAIADANPMAAIARVRSSSVVTAAGTSHVAGKIRQGARSDFAVWQVHADGTPGWRFLAEGTVQADGASAVALAPDGAVYAAGTLDNTGLLVRLNALTGASEWELVRPAALFQDLAIDAAGDVYAAGGPLIKVSAGQEVWAYTQPNTFFRIVTLDEAGNVYAAGREICGPHCFILHLVKLSPDGAVLWEGLSNSDVSDLVLDAARNVYVAGAGRDASEGPIAAIHCFSGVNGQRKWRRSFDGPDGAEFRGIALRGNAVLAAGSVFGPSEQDLLWLVQFNQQSGTTDWIYSRTNGTGADVAIGAPGAIYVCGTDRNGSIQFLVEKLGNLTAIHGVRALTAVAVDGDVLVSWEAEATAFAGFLIERSRSESGPWDRIGQVMGAGSELTYHDRDVVPGAAYYYRIVGVGRDGREAGASEAQFVAVPAVTTPVLHVVPNPVRSGAQITTFGAETPLELDLTDVTGRLLRTWAVTAEPGASHVIPWDRSGVPDGVYFLRLHGGRISTTTKVVLLKNP